MHILAKVVGRCLMHSGHYSGDSSFAPMVQATSSRLMVSLELQARLDIQKRAARALSSLMEMTSRWSSSTKNEDEPLQSLVRAMMAKLVGNATHPGNRSSSSTAVGGTRAKPPAFGGFAESVLDDSYLRKRGACLVLSRLPLDFGENVFNSFSMLWSAISTETVRAFGVSGKSAGFKSHQMSGETAVVLEPSLELYLIQEFRVLAIVLPTLKGDALSRVPDLLQGIIACLRLEDSHVELREHAGKCLYLLSKYCGDNTMQVIVQDVLTLLEDMTRDCFRKGASAAILTLLHKLPASILLPWIAFFVIPLLRRTTDSCAEVRKSASRSFAMAIRLAPLENATPTSESLSPALLSKKRKARQFLSQLLNGESVEDCSLSVTIKATLRDYQRQGVNWLAFLNRYNLNGILADDMGLGKTLQTICILAMNRENLTKEKKPILNSLVVCPSTLVCHWTQQISMFCATEVLSGISFPTTKPARVAFVERLVAAAKEGERGPADVIIVSYDVLRSHAEIFQRLRFDYCVLDEGHAIRNPNGSLAKACKSIRANHRLILTGTPIQNSALDLWSLFDFLMPGYLGDYAFFNSQYAKPIKAAAKAENMLTDRRGKISNSVKAANSGKSAAAKQAMDELHKQCLPFILRRMKEKVLKELPPKIIQDVPVEMSW